MGKRELLLVGAFVVIGVLLYQVTAAPTAPNPNALTARGVLDHLRRAVRGNRSSAEVERTVTQAVTADMTDIRLRLGTSAVVRVTGEERTDVEIHMKVSSNGYDDAEAQKLAKQAADGLKIDPAGAMLTATVVYPGPGTQRATFTLKVPSRLRVRVDQRGSATIANVAGVELADSRGPSSISNVAGAVTGVHRGGELKIDGATSAKLTIHNTETTIARVKDLTVTVRGGELQAEEIGGVLEIESLQSDVRIDKLKPTVSSVRVNANGGTIGLKSLRADARIDSRNANVDVVMDQPAPLAIYSDGGEDIEFTPPASGFKLDAVARDGRITPPDVLSKLGLTLQEDAESKEARVSGAVGGGGPTITLRANGGDIRLRSR